MDSGSQKVSGISISQFEIQTKQIPNIPYGTDDLSNKDSINGGEPLTQNTTSSHLLNEMINNFEDNNIFR